MTEDLSNKTIAMLLVLSILVTLTATLVFLSRVDKITGFQVQTRQEKEGFTNQQNIQSACADHKSDGTKQSILCEQNTTS